MQPRTTAILLVLAAALGAFVYFYEIGGEESRREADARAARLFADVEEGDIEVIRLLPREGDALRVERGAEGWRIREPVDFPADRSRADAMAAQLASLSSEGAFEDPADFEEYGLEDASALRVEFEAGERGGRLAVGNETPVGGKRYVAVEGSVHSLPNFDLSSFETTLDELRDRRILDFDTASIEKVNVGWPTGGLLLRRKPSPEGEATSGWEIISPVAAPADGPAVDGLLSNLSFLRAEDFIDEPEEGDLAIFEMPAFWLTLDFGDAATPLSMVVADPDASGRHWVRASGTALYEISEASFEDLPRDLFAYRHKQLSDFPAYEAKQLELYFPEPGGDPLVITARREAGRWSSSPESVDSARISSMLSTLSDLQASAIVAESVGEEELAALGLAPPRVILSAFAASEVEGEAEGEDAASQLTKLVELRLGVLDPEVGLVAQVRGDPVLYRIPVETAETLPASLEAFRARFAATPEEPLEAPLDDVPGTDFLPPAEESP